MWIIGTFVSENKLTVMKKLSITLFLGLAILLVNGQNIGFNLSRGVATVHPNYESLRTSMNQGMSFGAYYIKNFRKDVRLTSGVQVSKFYTGGIVQTKEGNMVAIPTSFMFTELPIIVEKDFYFLSMRVRKAAFFRVSGGLTLNHVKDGDTRNIVRGKSSGSSINFNQGAQLALQWVKPVSWSKEFAFGPVMKVQNTGSAIAPYSSYLGIKIDFRVY